jgi:dTDP-4-dehydrorhamnose reductase
VRRLRAQDAAHIAPSRDELDLADTAGLGRRLAALRPSAVINAAAYTDVARSEHPGEHETVFRLNRDGPQALARACSRAGLPLIHVSTDYVFDGRATAPYRETDPTAPLQVYGRSKLEGEQAVRGEHPAALIARVSTLFGPGRRARPHYVDAVLRQAERSDRLEVVRLPVSSPSYAPDLAEALLKLLRVGASGVVHVVNDGQCSRLELARETIRLADPGRRIEVRERLAPADALERPDFSVLDTSLLAALIGARLRPWREALREYVGEDRH